MSLTNDDVRQILKLIEESGYDDVRIETADLTLHVQKRGSRQEAAPVGSSGDALSAAPVAGRTADLPGVSVPAKIPAVASAAAAASLPEGVVAIRSPMLGTFFRAASPGENPFVTEGADVGPGDTVCLVEVMKLFNSVKAGVSGKVVKICVENGSMVEYDEILMLIEQRR